MESDFADAQVEDAIEEADETSAPVDEGTAPDVVEPVEAEASDSPGEGGDAEGKVPYRA